MTGGEVDITFRPNSIESCMALLLLHVAAKEAAVALSSAMLTGVQLPAPSLTYSERDGVNRHAQYQSQLGRESRGVHRFPRLRLDLQEELQHGPVVVPLNHIGLHLSLLSVADDDRDRARLNVRTVLCLSGAISPRGAIGGCDAARGRSAALPSPLSFPMVPAGHGRGVIDPAKQVKPLGQTVQVVPPSSS
eukprot:scaffold88358_cov71-Phaeocystis_antarctica.AAC.12